MRSGPLAGRYPAAAAMVIFALVPYLALSAALQPLTPIVAQQLHMSAQTMSLASGMANAGYAVGTVLAVLLAQHLPQRRMMVLYAALLVIGSVLAAGAQDAGMYIAGHILQGLCTSLLLIAAAPPLFLGYPISKLRPSAIIMNVCIFGAVAAGPLVGGIQASAHGWRPLFWVIAAVAAAALLLSVLTFVDAPPADRSAPRNPLAVGLAAVGCVAAFYGASELLTHRFLELSTVGPWIGGLLLIVTLLVYQYRAKRPLLQLRPLTSTLPISGIVVAVCAAAGSVSAIVLAAALLGNRFSPIHLGLLQFPEFGGALITAALLGFLFRTRGLHYLVLGGMLVARRRVVQLVEAAEQRLAALRRLRPSLLATSFFDGLAALGRRETLQGLLLWSVLVWVGAGMTIWTGVAGAGVSAGVAAILLTLVVTNIGMAVPSAPGYVGVFHGLVVLSLQPFGVDPSHALGAAIIIHAIVFGNFVVGGLWFMLRGGYSLGALRNASGH